MTSLEALIWCRDNRATVQWGCSQGDVEGVSVVVGDVHAWRPQVDTISFIDAVMTAKKLVEAAKVAS